MDAQSRDIVSWSLATFISACVAAGLIIRWVLVPYLFDKLLTPVQETHKQVTENHHDNSPPTVLDRIDDVSTDVRALTRVMDGHLEWSDRWTDLFERQLRQHTDQLDKLGKREGNPTDE